MRVPHPLMVTGKTISIGIIAIFLATSPALAANPVYHIVDLGSLDVACGPPANTGRGPCSNGTGINASGEVTGFSLTATGGDAFLYNGTTMLDLGTLGGDGSFGYGINDSGEVTGVSHTTGNAALDAFLYNGTTMLDLGRFGQDFSVGYGINASGEVTGASDTPNGSVHAFLYNGTTMLDLGTLGGTNSHGFGINASGEVAGTSDTTAGYSHAFLYNGTTMLDLGTLGGFESAGYAINAHGAVTGFSYTDPINNGPEHAFLYNGTRMLDLGALDGDTFGVGLGINGSGAVVGSSGPAGITPGRPPDHAFLYTGGVMFDLNSLISPTDPLYGEVVLAEATGINDSGQIVANGCYTSGPLNEECHAFLLQPIRFAGTPGYSNCKGQSVAALAQQFGGLNAAAAALGFASVRALQNAILTFCEG